MMIDKIPGISPINNVQNTRRASSVENSKSSLDSINISDEAKEMARAYFLKQVAQETSDVRSDLVAQIKEKIKDPNYFNESVISSAADRILTAYGL